MDRLLLVAALVVVAVAVAAVLRRRRPEPPTQPRCYQAPQQLDRADFDHADVPWLVVVFTSTTCDSCSSALEKAQVLASADVAVSEVSYQARKDLHTRYAVEAVPTTVAVDPDGVVRASFVGVPTATDLWAAVAEARSTD